MFAELLHTEVAGYRLDKIYHEGFSSTFNAVHTESQQNVAFKAIPKKHLVQTPLVTLVEFLSAIKNWQTPEIIPILDHGVQQDYIWVVRPWQENLNLLRLCQSNGMFEFNYATQMLSQCAEFLNILQENGLRHGNIKPSNIWIVNGVLQFSDLGLGADIVDVRDENITPYYLAPEQITSPQDVGIATDLYAVGIIFYEMLLGHPPYTGSYKEVLEKHVHADIPQLDDPKHKFPEIAQEWIQGLLAKSPSQRFSNTMDLLRETREFLASIPDVEKNPVNQPIQPIQRGLPSRLSNGASELKTLADSISQTNRKKFRIKRDSDTVVNITKPKTQKKQNVSGYAEQVILSPDKELPFAPVQFDDFNEAFHYADSDGTISPTQEKITIPLQDNVKQNGFPISTQPSYTPDNYPPQNMGIPSSNPISPLDAPLNSESHVPLQVQSSLYTNKWEQVALPSSAQMPQAPSTVSESLLNPITYLGAIPKYADLRPGMESPPSGVWQENTIPSISSISNIVAPPPPMPPQNNAATRSQYSVSSASIKLASTQKLSLKGKKKYIQSQGAVVIGIKKTKTSNPAPIVVTILAGFILGIFLFYCYSVSYEGANTVSPFQLGDGKIIDTNPPPDPIIDFPTTPTTNQITTNNPTIPLSNEILAPDKIPTTPPNEPIPNHVTAPNVTIPTALNTTPKQNSKTIKNPGWFWEEVPNGMEKTKNSGEYVWKRDQSKMSYVPEGPYWRGDKKIILAGFYIDRYELSNSQFLKFCQSTGATLPTLASQMGFQKPEQPVIGVNLYDAERYAKWSGKRLPTEAEWEKSARGGCLIPDYSKEDIPLPMQDNPIAKRIYPWGNKSPEEMGASVANYSSPQDSFVNTAPIGSFPKGVSPYGCHDMAGNVWEWCADVYDVKFYQNPPEKNPKNPPDPKKTNSRKRVCHGGSWKTMMQQLQISGRISMDANEKNHSTGIRLAK